MYVDSASKLSPARQPSLFLRTRTAEVGARLFAVVHDILGIGRARGRRKEMAPGGGSG